jgi:hypothetical protein
MDRVQVVLRDREGGNILCDTELQVFCQLGCDCDDADAFSIDDGSTPDTINPNGNVTIYVDGGCPPFSWSISGNGYSFLDGYDTMSRYNKLASKGGT